MNFPPVDPSQNDAPTSWSLVRDTANAKSVIALSARDRFYRRYAPAIYAWSRAHCRSAEDAEDLTQSFFEHLIETNWFARLDPAKGRLRPFMMKTLEHHKNNVWRKSCTQKRGEGKPHLSFNLAEVFLEVEQLGGLATDPARAFHQQWVRSMINETLDRLEGHYAERGKGDIFRILSPWITSGDVETDSASAEDDTGDYAALAESLGTTPGAARMAVCRIRAEYIQALKRRVAKEIGTSDKTAIRAELLFLLDAA